MRRSSKTTRTTKAGSIEPSAAVREFLDSGEAAATKRKPAIDDHPQAKADLLAILEHRRAHGNVSFPKVRKWLERKHGVKIANETLRSYYNRLLADGVI